jgi:hypothetical protein
MPEPTARTEPSLLQRQVQELTDRAEIAELVSRLGLWLDEKRFDDAGSIFVEDVAVTTRSGTTRGIDAAAALARQHHSEERTHHVITNVVIDLDGDRADVRANLIATFVPVASAPEMHRSVGERYRFEAARTPPGWRLARVEASPVWRTAPPNVTATVAETDGGA